MYKSLNLVIMILIIFSLTNVISANDFEHNIDDNEDIIKIKNKSINKEIIPFSDAIGDDSNSKITLYQSVATVNVDKKYKNERRVTNIGENKLVSKDNPLGDDTNPKITRNSEGIIVITYEKNSGYFPITNPIIFSNDNGENWNLKFDVSSEIFNLTGITRSPDLAYNPNLDVFYYASFDPDAEIYNNVMGFISGDIINAEEMLMYAISVCGDDYLETAVTTTENFFLSANIRDGHTLSQYLDIAYFTYPDFESPPVMSGFYPDFESIHKTSPASNIEMDSGNRIYLVAESGVEGGPKITIKSTSANEGLLTNGELQNGMDKYADIEQWPGEYIDSGIDPDVSALGNKVYVVYTQNDVVKCAYSTAESGYEPAFNWHVSNVATDAGYPAVYAIGDKVICAYVKDMNLYMVESEDGGVSWGVSYQLNDIEGTVVEEAGSVDLNDVGVVWTDVRNGSKDIYFQSIRQQDLFIPKISISGGLGFTIIIENLGNLSINDVHWFITIDAPFLFFGVENQGNISLDAYDSIEIRIPVFGFGKIMIEVECEYGGYASESGFLIGPFVFIKSDYDQYNSNS